jgi:hypothetical protein
MQRSLEKAANQDALKNSKRATTKRRALKAAAA